MLIIIKTYTLLFSFLANTISFGKDVTLRLDFTSPEGKSLETKVILLVSCFIVDNSLKEIL